MNTIAKIECTYTSEEEYQKTYNFLRNSGFTVADGDFFRLVLEKENECKVIMHKNF